VIQICIFEIRKLNADIRPFSFLRAISRRSQGPNGLHISEVDIRTRGRVQ